jgi:nucleoside-diphosphate-sugar epimerase
MKVFVTGASGYIGSALTQELIAHGHTVIGLARSDASAEKLKTLGAQVQRGGIEDLDVLQTTAAAADGVAHLAFDHIAMASGDIAGAAKKDNAVVTAIGEVLAGTGKPFIISSGTLILAAAGRPVDEDYAAPIEGFGAGRALSEQIAVGLAEKGVRSGVIRFPPTVHGGDLKPSSFTKQLVAAARKHGFAGYIDEHARWPAANVFDAAVLCRLALESGKPGWRYHAAADEGNRIFDLAHAIGEHIGVPVKAVSREEAMAHWGFIGMILGTDNPTSSALTRERTGWKPTYPSLVEELKAGKYFD